ncbi:hypothetical protein ACLMJK_000459 [Lecanora helva]
MSRLNAAVSRVEEFYIVVGDTKSSERDGPSEFDTPEDEGVMDRDHELFEGSLDRAFFVIVTSYSTFAERHWPKALRKHRINNLGWSKPKADHIAFVNDPHWRYNLERQLEIVLLDEANTIKDLTANVANSVAWLQTDFHVLVTASPEDENDQCVFYFIARRRN